MPILSAQNILKHFGLQKVLNEVSIDLHEGVIHGLLGQNGAGKTTLLRILTHLYKPDSGQVLYNNRSLDKAIAQGFGYLPEERGLYKSQAILDQLIFWAMLRGVSKAEAFERSKKWLELFDLLPYSHKKLGTLSKGNQQKVQFIAAVLHKPKVLLLDEPFSGFDFLTAKMVQDELTKMKNNGAAILISIHNMALAEKWCDEVTFLHKGNMLASGTLAHLKNQFGSQRIVIKYTGSKVALADALWIDFELVEHETKAGFNLAVVQLKSEAEMPHLIERLANKVSIIAAYEEQASLEEIFVDIASETYAE